MKTIGKRQKKETKDCFSSGRIAFFNAERASTVMVFRIISRNSSTEVAAGVGAAPYSH